MYVNVLFPQTKVKWCKSFFQLITSQLNNFKNDSLGKCFSVFFRKKDENIFTNRIKSGKIL